MRQQLPLIVIVGPTASGKTSLAIELAKKFGGEIICADSRTIYKGMDIGTAKPTLQEQAEVPHWGLDLVEPGELFNVADFKAYATRKIDEIRSRGNIPFMVGGTGLYIDAVVFDYGFGAKADPKLRKELDGMNLKELHMYCRAHNIKLPDNALNKRYVIRTIELQGCQVTRRSEPIDKTTIVGITTSKEDLMPRIIMRANNIINNGVVDEATYLGKKYGWESEAMTGNVYPLVYRYIKGEISLEQAKVMFTTLDWRLAKRQLTWLRRNHHIIWLPSDKAYSKIQAVLAPE